MNYSDFDAAEWSRTITPRKGHKPLKLSRARSAERKTARRAKSSPAAGLHEIRARIYSEVAAAGFDDVRPAHVTLFRWPGPDGRRPTEIAADAQISKQRVNDLLRDLERCGYLRLEPDPTDGRARIVRLTARGRRLHRAAVDVHAAVEEEWKAQVGTRRYAQMRETLAELLAARSAPTSSASRALPPPS